MDPLSEIGTLDFVPWSGCGGSRLTCISCLVSPRRRTGRDNIGDRDGPRSSSMETMRSIAFPVPRRVLYASTG